MRRISAIILAAGSGQRLGSETPKQFLPLAGRPILDWSYQTMHNHPLVNDVLLVLPPDTPAPLPDHAIHGGLTRQQSVYLALQAISGTDAESVLIHDSARPFVGEEDINRLIKTHRDHNNEAATLAMPCTDTLRKSDGETLDREGVWLIQTPQIFDVHSILKCHEQAERDRLHVTDDAGLVTYFGAPLHFVEGHRHNFKITTAQDYDMACSLIGPDIRTGQGYDVHAIDPNRSDITLFGVTLPNEFGLKGHSDADVGLHALTDAIYGACGAGDIGRHFPPSDPQWVGQDSTLFLEHALTLMHDMGGRLNHMDVTLICERPKLTPHHDSMKERLSHLCNLPRDRIGLKATTSEKLGFTGRGEGIAAQAVVTVYF